MIVNIGICVLFATSFPPVTDMSLQAGDRENLLPYSTAGIPLMRNYTTEDFGRHTQHWSIDQLPGGEMVFGSIAGARIYDGHTWHFIQPPADNVFSVAYGTDDLLYIGGLNEFGYVTTDTLGHFVYTSLKQHIPEQYLDFSRIWQMVITGDGLYLRSPEYIFRWDGEKLHVWEPDTRFGFIGYVHDILFVWQSERGLYRLKNDVLEPLADGDIFAGHYVRILLPYDDQRTLVGTRTGGFFLYDGTGFERWETEAEAFITDNVLYHGASLPDGSFVFGTLHGGAAIVERDGRIRYILDRQAGLADHTVLFLFVDRNGALWLALDNGLSRIEPLSPITVFDARNGINESVNCIKEHRGIIYSGTTSGLAILDPRNVAPNGYGVFIRIPEISTGVRSFSGFGDDLLAATDEGIYRIRGARAELIHPAAIRKVLVSRVHDNIIYGAFSDRFVVFRYRDGEVTLLAESGRILDPETLVEDDDGSVYVGTSTNGVYRFEWEYRTDTDGLNESVFQNIIRFGPPEHWDNPLALRVLSIGGTVRVAAYDGLYRIAEDFSGLIPDTMITGKFPGEPAEIFTVAENDRGEIYFSSLGYKRRAVYDDERGRYIIKRGVLDRIYIPEFSVIYALYADSFDNLWIGGSDRIHRVATAGYDQYVREYTAGISEVLLNADSLVYRGMLQTGTRSGPLLLPYTDNDLRFRFFIPAYEEVGANRYQTKLEPLDEDWSRWTRESFKDYTNLREGRYRFRVRGRDVYGNVSEAAVFEFRVLPPWYRTWWSYGMAGLLLTLFLLTIHKYRVYRLLEVERTRTRIARDLHDDIGSSLSSIALMIDMFSNKETIPDEDKSELSNIGGTARDMVDSLRDVVWVINPEHDNLATLVERMKSTAGNMLHNIDFTFDTDVSGIHESVGMDFKRSVLLIYKEALNNIIKHSYAKSVSIEIRESDGMFRMRIADDGIGFDASQSADGNGLENMRYRAQQINGMLFIESASGAGTIIELKAELM